MKQNKETLKEYFETGDKPTQEQFSDLIDSYVDAQQESGEANRRFIIDETGEVSVSNELEIPEYTLSEIIANKLSLLKDGAVVQEIDLTAYVDDTNLARLVSGTIDENGLATFIRDDDTTFDLDLSPLVGLVVKNSLGEDQFRGNEVKFDEFHTFNTQENEVKIETDYFRKMEPVSIPIPNTQGVNSTSVDSATSNVLEQTLLTGPLFKTRFYSWGHIIVFSFESFHVLRPKSGSVLGGSIKPNAIEVELWLEATDCQLRYNTNNLTTDLLIGKMSISGDDLSAYDYNPLVVAHFKNDIVQTILGSGNILNIPYVEIDTKGNVLNSVTESYQIQNLGTTSLYANRKVDISNFKLKRKLIINYLDADNTNGQNEQRGVAIFTGKVIKGIL